MKLTPHISLANSKLDEYCEHSTTLNDCNTVLPNFQFRIPTKKEDEQPKIEFFKRNNNKNSLF